MKNVLLAIVCIGIIYFIIHFSKTKEPIVEKEGTVTLTSEKKCYEYHQAATPTAPYAVDETITLSTSGTTVTGEKKGTQNGPDMTNGYNGTLTGTKEGDIIQVVFDYTIEGSHNREQELYKDIGGGLQKLRYPLVEKGGMLVPDTTAPYKVLIYALSQCAD